MTLLESPTVADTDLEVRIGDVFDLVTAGRVTEARAAREALVRASVDHHILSSPAYARYAETYGWTAGGRSTLDLPLLATALFKGDELIANRNDGPGVAICASSGTRGSISRVARDDATLTHFFRSIEIGLTQVARLPRLDLPVVHLGPALEHSQHLWSSYVMAGVELLTDTTHWMDESFDAQGALEHAIDRRDGVVIVGSPLLVVELAQLAAERNCPPFGPDARIITLGGWKRSEDRSVDRQILTELVCQGFGTAPAQVLDAFNMVELNTVVFECSYHHKHLPEWLLVRARHPWTLEPLQSGASGVLAFADPTALSYPAVYLGDDFGSVSELLECPCGLTSDVLRIERRVNTFEQRGCSLKIDTMRR